MMMATQLRQCRQAHNIGRAGLTLPTPCNRPAHQSCRGGVQSSALSDVAVLAQIVQGMPPSNAAAQNAAQNALQNAPLGVKETPEKLLIAGSLIAVAVGGYLLREKFQKK